MEILKIVLLFVGFGLLIKGADWLVAGAASIAKRYNVPNIVIGLTIVAFGTSTPELIVSLFASMNGSTDIAIGNVIGSNSCNILLILGISSIIYPLSVKSNTVWKEIPLSLLAAVLVWVLANDMILDGNPRVEITRSDGLVLLGFFAIFMYYTFDIAKADANNPTTIESDEIKILSLFWSIIFIILGLTSLVVGGNWIVEGAVYIAKSFGLSEALIGLTIVAIGTSLPEMATSVMAALKKQDDIAIGNVVGSNIFNVFFILGTSATVSPLKFDPKVNTDIYVTMAASLFLFIFCFSGKKHQLERWEGSLMFLGYVSYTAFLIMRG
ncbi:MAG TPA: sodium:proton exchanger [Microscillaceae bacterium]|jgi:cation:H+ antiporter|nr:sodium:proton exchanger [Microscillaceae bacterium]